VRADVSGPPGDQPRHGVSFFSSRRSA
jgi:hypothetical protein